MTCGRVLQYHTMIFEWGVTPLLQQGGSKNTRWFISHYDFRIGCEPPPSVTVWFKNTRWFISHYDFRMGCDHHPSATGWFKFKKFIFP